MTGAVALCALLLLWVAAAAQATEETPPKVVTPPTIGGTPIAQFTNLNAKHGEWSGNRLVYSYQWQRCEAGTEPECSNIATATTSSYTLQYADIGAKVRVIVTASNSKGSAEATSGQTETVKPLAPRNTSSPAISGVYQEGQLLSATKGEWSGTPASRYTIEWERCNGEGVGCKVIAGATESSYRTTSEDVGHRLKVNVTVFVEVLPPTIERNARSAATPVIEHGPPVALDQPAISGALRVGGQLDAATGKWVGQAPISYGYTWERCSGESSCSAVGEGPSYTVAEGEVGDSLRVSVTASNSIGSATTQSMNTPAVLGSGEHEDFAVAWGEGYRGQLGTMYRTSWEADPVLVEGVSNISSIAAGGSGSYELHGDGTISAAGAGEYGTIGYGGRKATWEQGLSHVAVKGISDAIQISAATESAAALLADGRVVDWGNNGYGILGNGRGGFEKETGQNQLEPKEVTSLKGAGVTSVVAGWGDRFALLPGGKVDGWGYNRWGQLGVKWSTECRKVGGCEAEYGTQHSKPKRLKEGEPEHKCLVETGWELCFKKPAPVVYEENEAKPLEGVTQIAAGAESAYALLESGEVLSWGNDGKGQLGQETEPAAHTSFTSPGNVMVGPHEPLKDVVAISAEHSAALAVVRREDGSLSLYGWGADGGDALGPAAETCGKLNKNGGGKTWACDRWARQLSAPEGVHIAQVAAGSQFVVLLGTDGRAYTIGSNALGQLGRGQGCELGGGHMGLYEPCYSDVWEAVPGLEHVKAVAATHLTALALVEPGAAQPLPVVGYQPNHHQLQIGWGLPDAESAEDVVYRKWEHPGEMEVSESEGEGEGEGGAGETEEEPEEGTGEAPTVEVAPAIKPWEWSEEQKEWVKAKLKVGVGDQLRASPGMWNAKPEPYAYEYTWLRCTTTCKAIADAGGSGEEASVYLLGEEDAGDSIEVQVTARNGVKPAGTGVSELTETIKAAEEGRKQGATRVNVPGLDGVLLSGLEEPETEVKLSSSGGPKGRTRQMVLRPAS